MARAIVTGDAKLDRVLRDLDLKMQKKIARGALAKSLTPVAQAIKSEVPGWKSVRKAIGKRNKKNKRSGLHQAKVGVNVGKKPAKKGEVEHGKPIPPGKQVPWATPLATGTGKRFIKTGKRKGQYTGRIDKDNFVQRGWNRSKSESLDTLQKSIWDGIVKGAK